MNERLFLRVAASFGRIVSSFLTSAARITSVALTFESLLAAAIPKTKIKILNGFSEKKHDFGTNFVILASI